MQQDVCFFLVEEYFARRRSNEHAQEHERHSVQVDAQEKEGLPEKHQGHHAEERIEDECPGEFLSDGLRDLVLLEAAGAVSAEEERQEQSAQRLLWRRTRLGGLRRQ